MNSSTIAERFKNIESKTPEELENLYFDWSIWALAKQTPPEGNWTTWLLMGGRGSGKTRAGAEWVRSLAAQRIGPIALVGETMAEAIAIMVRGESGILSVHPEDERPTLRGQQLHWPNGVEATVMSASDPDRFRGPQFAAAWCDELGCAAVDKGANQPNIFGDPKSSESGRPYFSSGNPDPLIQRQLLRAHQAYWRDGANNPAGMVDVSRLYLWTWDARPYPAFPAMTEVWSDGPNHRNGHWLTGRLGGMASDELARAMATDHGVTLTAEPAAPFITGCVLGQATTAREALEPVIEATGLSLRNRVDGLHLGVARRALSTLLEVDALVQADEPVLARRRGDPAERPGRLVLTYQDRERDYLNAAVTALVRADGTLAGENTTLTLDAAGARLVAERMLDSRAARYETLDFALPQAALALEPGDLVELAGVAEGPFEITQIRDGQARRITTRTVPNGTAVATGSQRSLAIATTTTVRARPLVLAAHLPALPADPTRSRLVVSAFAQPWPGRVQIAEGATGTILTELARSGAIGSLATALSAGPVAVWDRAADILVDMLGGHLGSAEESAVLAGSNRLAVQSASGDWEVLGFASAELVAPGRYRLRNLLRGQQGTQPGPAATGAGVILLDGNAATIPVEPHLLGETRGLRVYAGGRDTVGATLDIDVSVAPALPLAPVHLRGRRLHDDVVLEWVRCSRADGDGWGAADSALEHVPERYAVDIVHDGTVLRAMHSNTPTLAYLASDQMADFGMLPTSFSFTIRQVSPVLGPGLAGTGVFHG